MEVSSTTPSSSNPRAWRAFRAALNPCITLGAWASRSRGAIDRFLYATRQAKEILAGSEAEWQRLAPRIGVSDAKALAIYRQRYREGIVRRPLDEEVADARALYLVLAETGGTELVGPARELAAGTFYRPGE